MAVYDIADYQLSSKDESVSKKDRMTSSLLARGLFFLLLLVDMGWIVYAMIAYLCLFPFGHARRARRFLLLKRSLVCFLSLLTAIFSPSLGILYGCTYFMVFDKEGIDEVIPSSLRSQFEEFFPS